MTRDNDGEGLPLLGYGASSDSANSGRLQRSAHPRWPDYRAYASCSTRGTASLACRAAGSVGSPAYSGSLSHTSSSGLSYPSSASSACVNTVCSRTTQAGYTTAR